MRVEIVIDELVLHGVDPRDRHRVADALERELTRLAASNPQRWRHLEATDVLQASDAPVARGAGGVSPAALGAQIAGALAVRLAGPEARAPHAAPPPRDNPGVRRPASAGREGANGRSTP